MLKPASLEQCQQALDALKQCVELELSEYGDAGYDELKRMESEAPAPSPCMDAYNHVLETLGNFNGDMTALALGEFHEHLRKRSS